MQINGAVAATKSLRDKSQPLESRVHLADQIINGQLDVILPRKEAVILEWIFDTLAIDTNARAYLPLWTLLLSLWPQVPEQAQQRVYKNHKYIVNLTNALAANTVITPEWIHLLADITQTLAHSVSLFGLTSEFQVSQLVLAYLAVEFAPNTYSKCQKAYLRLGGLIFEGVQHRKNLFGKRSDVSDLLTLLREPDVEHKKHYLRDYFSSHSNPIVDADHVDARFENEDNLGVIISSLGDSQVNVTDRIIALVNAMPSKSSFILNTLQSTHAKFLTADVLKQILKNAFKVDSIDWSVLAIALRVSPAAVLDNAEHVEQTITAIEVPPGVLALLLQKLGQQRQLFDFLKTWNPLPGHLTPLVSAEFARAIETLSSSQIVQLLEMRLPIVGLIVSSLNYRMANNFAVKDALKTLITDIDTSPEATKIKITISELVPDVSFEKPNKKEDTELLLRQFEIQGSDKKLVKYIMSSVSKTNTGLDPLVLRYYPSLQQSLDEQDLFKMLELCEVKTRETLASTPAALELENLTKVLIDVAIAKKELSVLSRVSKSVYSWDQRHRAVEAMISALPFSEAGDLVTDLIDFQHLPVPKLLGQFVASARPEQASRFLELCKTLRKDPQYIKQFHAVVLPWQQAVISASSQPNADEVSRILNWLKEALLMSEELVEPIISALALLPTNPEVTKFTAQLALQLIPRGHCSAHLFELLCNQGNHWSVIAAVFVAVDHQFEAEFAAYCLKLPKSDQLALVLTAAHEHQYGILKTVIKHRLFARTEERKDSMDGAMDDAMEEDKIDVVEVCRKSFTLAVLTAINGNERSTEFWGFIDALLRETTPLLSQFALEATLMYVSTTLTNASTTGIQDHWNACVLIISRLLLFKRYALRNRFHLVVHALTEVLKAVRTRTEAEGFTRLVDNFVNPPQGLSKQRAERHQLTSQVAKERRYVSRVAGVLLQNIVLVILAKADELEDWGGVSQTLRPAAFLLVDLVQNEGLRAVSAGMDGASRAYLRKIFEDYKLFEKWTSD